MKNPQAFPIPIAGCSDGGVYNTLEQSGGENGGMTLLDYFAGQALIGLLSSQSVRLGGDELDTPLKRADACYSFAFAMLTAREQVLKELEQ